MPKSLLKSWRSSLKMQPWRGLRMMARLIALTLILAIFNVVPCYAKTVTIHIKDMEFSPVETFAHVGDTVEWVNEDFVAHTATVKDEWDFTIPPNAQLQLPIKKTASF